MNEDERALLIADITAQVTKNLTGQDYRTTKTKEPDILKELYEKYKEPLYIKYGTGAWHNVWEWVRKLATYYAGKRYVRDLLPSEAKVAADFAENILIQMLEE